MQFSPALVFTLAFLSVLPTHAAPFPPTPPDPQVEQSDNSQSVNQEVLPTGLTHKENDVITCDLLEGDQENPENDQKVLNYCFQSKHCTSTGKFLIYDRYHRPDTISLSVVEAIYPALFRTRKAQLKRRRAREICTGTGPKPAPRIKCICKDPQEKPRTRYQKNEDGYPPECRIEGRVDNEHVVSSLCRRSIHCAGSNPNRGNAGWLKVGKYSPFTKHSVYGSMFDDITKSGRPQTEQAREKAARVMDICQDKRPGFPVHVFCKCELPAGADVATANTAATQPGFGDTEGGEEASQPGTSPNLSDTGHASDGSSPVAHAYTSSPQAQGQSSTQDAGQAPRGTIRPHESDSDSDASTGQAPRRTIRPHESDSDSNASTGQAPPPAKRPRISSEEATKEAANALININRDSW